MTTRLTAVAAAGALIFGMGISAVSAESTEAYGSYTYNTWASNADWVSNKDTANDNQFTAGRWKYTGGSQGADVVNKKGYGQTVTLLATYSPTKVTHIVSCRSRTLLPMICGDWKSTGR